MTFESWTLKTEGTFDMNERPCAIETVELIKAAESLVTATMIGDGNITARPWDGLREAAIDYLTRQFKEGNGGGGDGE